MSALKSVMPNVINDAAQEHIRFFEQLKLKRSNWEVQWNDVAKIVLPDDLNSFQGTRMVEGDKRTQYLYDSTANIAINRAVAIFDSLLTPHASMWHSLMSEDPDLLKNKNVKIYLEDVRRILFRERYRQSANFIEQNQNVYLSVLGYGTGGMFIDQLWGQKGLRYKFTHLGELYHSENHQGIPDKAYRHFRLTARQAFQRWGDKLPRLVQDMAKNQPETLYEFLHAVVPNESQEPGRFDYKGMKYASSYISIIEGKLLEEGGFNTFPYSISKYRQSLTEVYGRSPISDVLPTIKTVNEAKKALLKQAHRILDPVYLVHDDGILNTMSARPGTVVAGGMTADGRQLVGTLPTGNIQLGKENIDDDRNDIKDSLFVTLFQILVETPEMTATEVMERVKEKGMLIAPTIGRQEAYLSRVIDRELDLLSQQGLLPPMPNELKMRGGAYKPKYESPLAKMRRAEEASGLMRMLENSLQIVQATQDPSVMMYFNWDEIMPDLADIGAVPQRWINTVDKVQQLKKAMQEQQAVQNAIQAGPAAAAVLKATKG